MMLLLGTFSSIMTRLQKTKLELKFILLKYGLKRDIADFELLDFGNRLVNQIIEDDVGDQQILDWRSLNKSQQEALFVFLLGFIQGISEDSIVP